MRGIIEKVLQRHQDGQINLSSRAARKALAEEIAIMLADRGTYTEYGEEDQPEYPIPEYDPQTGQKNPLYGELMTEMDKKITQMEETLQDDQRIRYIYESPDGGKTIYRRPMGDYDSTVRELVKSPDRDISFTPEF